jgi:ketosteroid isomerase-like protein
MAQAMPQENLRITREGLDAFNEGNLDWLRQSHHPEIEWKTSSEDPDAATHCGPDAVRRYFEQWMESFAGLRAEFDECFAFSEDRVFATLHFIGRGSTSGVDMDWRLSLVYTYRDRMLIRVEEYFDRAEALEAAGLAEADGGQAPPRADSNPTTSSSST